VGGVAALEAASGVSRVSSSLLPKLVHHTKFLCKQGNLIVRNALVFRYGNLGAGSGHSYDLDPTGAGVSAILHPHPTRTEMGSGAGLVLHPWLTRRVPKKSPTIFFTRHPSGPTQLGAHLNA
jgi:hypothetical protein